MSSLGGGLISFPGKQSVILQKLELSFLALLSIGLLSWRKT